MRPRFIGERSSGLLLFIPLKPCCIPLFCVSIKPYHLVRLGLGAQVLGLQNHMLRLVHYSRISFLPSLHIIQHIHHRTHPHWHGLHDLIHKLIEIHSHLTDFNKSVGSCLIHLSPLRFVLLLFSCRAPPIACDIVITCLSDLTSRLSPYHCPLHLGVMNCLHGLPHMYRVSVFFVLLSSLYITWHDSFDHT